MKTGSLKATKYALHAAPLVLLLLLPAACGERDRSESKVHAEGEAKASHEGHDHDSHGHGEESQGDDDHHDHAHGEHEDEVKLTSLAVRANDIQVRAAKSEVLKGTLVVPARVSVNAERVAHVGTAVSGRVTGLNTRVGAAVKSGEPLLVIDSPDLGRVQAEYLQKRIAASSAATTASLAQSSYERAKKLFDERQGTSLNEVQKREAEFKAAQAEAATAKQSAIAALNELLFLGMTPEEVKEFETSGKLNPRAALRSPIDGQVTELHATLGERVTPETESILTVSDLKTLWVLADVPESRLREVTKGAKATVTVAAHPEREFEGTLALVSSELDPATRTVRVRIVVDNREELLLPGMFASTEISVSPVEGSEEPVISVVEEAVQTVEGEQAVFVPVPGEENTFAKRQVATGKPIGGKVPIFAGLKEGEKYVSRGSFILKAELGKAGAAHEH
jgi:membrane fusion protein, heavy metal efflux system